MNQEIEALLKRNMRTAEEIELWADELHKLGYSFRLPIGERHEVSFIKGNHTFHLIEGDPQRSTAGIPQPSFMGYDGYALRKID
jgi:hypothetical protein